MSLLTSTATATIASGESLSGPVCLGAKLLCAIQMPAAWDAADLTFQISDDGGSSWTELLDAVGTAIIVSGPAAGERLEIDASDFKSAIWLKVRSGTSALPVGQTADRALQLISRKFYPR